MDWRRCADRRCRATRLVARSLYFVRVAPRHQVSDLRRAGLLALPKATLAGPLSTAGQSRLEGCAAPGAASVASAVMERGSRQGRHRSTVAAGDPAGARPERFLKKKLAFHSSILHSQGHVRGAAELSGPPHSRCDVTFLRELIAQNPGLSRRRLSVKVCEAWQWVQPNGQPRDMVCRGLMLALHRAGHIELPAKRQAPANNAIAHRRVAAGQVYDTTPIVGPWPCWDH